MTDCQSLWAGDSPIGGGGTAGKNFPSFKKPPWSIGHLPGKMNFADLEVDNWSSTSRPSNGPLASQKARAGHSRSAPRSQGKYECGVSCIAIQTGLALPKTLELKTINRKNLMAGDEKKVVSSDCMVKGADQGKTPLSSPPRSSSKPKLLPQGTELSFSLCKFGMRFLHPRVFGRTGPTDKDGLEKMRTESFLLHPSPPHPPTGGIMATEQFQPHTSPPRANLPHFSTVMR